VDAPGEAKDNFSSPLHTIGERDVTELNKDEKVVVAKSDIVAKSDFNVANVIAAIALLLLVMGLLKYLGASPF
jgi:hypothetical protein